MHSDGLDLQYLGRYNDRKVYKGAVSHYNAPDKESIYLVSCGKNQGYNMYINRKLVGSCDNNYKIDWYEEPAAEVEERTFTSSSWTTTPNPPVIDEPKKPEPQPTPVPTVSSSDFWTRVQQDIDNVLKSTTLSKSEEFKFDFH